MAKYKHKHAVLTPHDELPEGHELGGAKPKIRNRTDVATAVQCIHYFKSRSDTVNTRLKQEIALKQMIAAQELQYEIDGTTMAFSDREKDLRKAVNAYCLAHPDRVFPEGTRTVRFPGGDVQIRKTPPALQYEGDLNAEKVKDQLCEQSGLLAKIMGWLKRFKLLPWLKVTVALDVAGIGRAVKAGDLTAEQLAELGLRYEGAEEAYVKLADFTTVADGASVRSPKRLTTA